MSSVGLFYHALIGMPYLEQFSNFLGNTKKDMFVLILLSAQTISF
jgi:hypothetical protein